MTDHYKQLREFIDLVDRNSIEEHDEEISTISNSQLPPIVNRLQDMVFLLNSLTENESPSEDYCLGVETGLRRAADMLENIINTYRDSFE